MFAPYPRSDPSNFKRGNSCHQYSLILILILGSINKNSKTYFYLHYIFSFQMKKIIEEVNSSYRDGKTKKLPKNLKPLKISYYENIMTSTIFYEVRGNN